MGSYFVDYVLNGLNTPDQGFLVDVRWYFDVCAQ